MQGSALADQARTKTGAEADRLWTLAGEKYEAALKIKPDNHEALNNWGGAFILQGATKSGTEAERLFDQGREKALAAEELSPGAGSYNLACAFARLGQESNCREWLEKCKAQVTLPSADHIRDDPDFAGVREQEWFEKFLASL